MQHQPANPEAIYNPEERAQMLEKMRGVNTIFYRLAQQTGVHAFIEFSGLMHEFIQICERAHKEGLDFNATNRHTSGALPMMPYEAAYLGEKLGCIYGNALQDTALFAEFQRALGIDRGVPTVEAP